MLHRSTLILCRFLVAIVLLTAGLGCIGSVLFLSNVYPEEKYAFGVGVAMSALGIPVPERNANATASPTIFISESAGPGAKPGTGVTYVYEKTASGWTVSNTLYDANATAWQAFGQVMQTRGNDVIIGGPTANSFAGRAFVFSQTGTTWTQQGELKGLDTIAGDGFGSAVAIDGNNALVGARFADPVAPASGAVYAFTRSGTAWTQSQKLTAAMPKQNDNFGQALLLDGTEALIASYNTSAYPFPDSGGRIHRWSLAGGTWTEGPTLRPNDASQNKQFGSSLARQGKWLVVGAPGESAVAVNAGAVYVFERVGNDWIQRQKLSATDGMANDRFGGSVSIDGDWIVVGATNATGKTSDSGAAYVFELDGTWTFAGKLVASQGANGDEFGGSVAVSGDLVVVGAEHATAKGVPNAGAAYVFTIPQHFGTQRLLTEARRFAFGKKSASD